MEHYVLMHNPSDDELKPHFDKCIAEGRRLLDKAEQAGRLDCSLVVLYLVADKDGDSYKASGMNYGEPLLVMTSLKDCALAMMQNTIISMKGGGNEPAH